jgi:retron-type reverse transcriptase
VDSAETALLHLLNNVYSAADNKRVSVLVGLDISTAFDTISHDILISRLDVEFGVRSLVSQWLRSYLTDRHQYVKLGRHSSATTRCRCGVPQGSVLGPLLFAAYVTPVGNIISSHGVTYHQFANDTQLLISMNTTDTAPTLQQLTDCSDDVRAWFI